MAAAFRKPGPPSCGMKEFVVQLAWRKKFSALEGWKTSGLHSLRRPKALRRFQLLGGGHEDLATGSIIGVTMWLVGVRNMLTSPPDPPSGHVAKLERRNANRSEFWLRPTTVHPAFHALEVMCDVVVQLHLAHLAPPSFWAN